MVYLVFYPTVCIYIGLYQPANDDWVWHETGKVSDFLDFHPGEPNGAGSEDCVTMYRGLSYGWADYSCFGSCSMICEF